MTLKFTRTEQEGEDIGHSCSEVSEQITKTQEEMFHKLPLQLIQAVCLKRIHSFHRYVVPNYSISDRENICNLLYVQVYESISLETSE